MLDVIDYVYKGTFEPSENSMRNDKEYVKAKNQVKQCYQVLSERLPRFERETLDKLVSCYAKEMDRKNMRCFKTGFKVGLDMAMKSFT